MAASRTRRAPEAAPEAEAERRVSGTARLGRRTKELVKRLRAGDIAVIDHRDLDRVSAEELIERRAGAVVNRGVSSTGSYPNTGPLLLVRAGIHLVDAPDAPLFERLRDGEEITLAGGDVYRGDELVAHGTVQEPSAVEASTDERRREIGEALELFARNTVEHMVAERELLAGKIELPRFRTDFRDRPALIVVRGVDHKRDLRALRPYIRDVKPVLVGVDGGADALREEGYKPDMIVGDMDSATSATLLSGAELVVHAYVDGRAPGAERMHELGLDHEVVPAPGTSEDIAMLIAAEKGARLIVSVGSHFNLVDFLDKARRGMSSTFLTRLRVGELFVDAKGVSRLYTPRPGPAPLRLVIAAGLLCLVVVVWTTPALRGVVELLWLKLQLVLGLRA